MLREELLAALVGRLPVLEAELVVLLEVPQPVPHLLQGVERFRLVLEERDLRFQPLRLLRVRGDLRDPAVEIRGPLPLLGDRRLRPQPLGVLGLELPHGRGGGLRLAGQPRHPGRARHPLALESFEARRQFRELRHPLRAGRDLPLLGLDLRMDLRVALLRPLLGPLERLQAEQLLEDLEAVRAPLGAEVLHLLLPDERGVREPHVVEAEDVADRPLPLRDRAADRLAVAGELEVRLLLRREPAPHVEPGVPLAERDPHVSAGPAEFVDRRVRGRVRPRRGLVQGERDRVEDRALARPGLPRDRGELLRESDWRFRLPDVPHEPAHLDLLDHEPVARDRRLGRDLAEGLDRVVHLHPRTSRSTRSPSARIASRRGSFPKVWSM